MGVLAYPHDQSANLRILIVRALRKRRWRRSIIDKGGLGIWSRHDIDDEKASVFQLSFDRGDMRLIHPAHTSFIGTPPMSVKDRYAHLVAGLAQHPFRVTLIFMNLADRGRCGKYLGGLIWQGVDLTMRVSPPMAAGVSDRFWEVSDEPKPGKRAPYKKRAVIK
jgi:hypothetical protein